MNQDQFFWTASLWETQNRARISGVECENRVLSNSSSLFRPFFALQPPPILFSCGHELHCVGVITRQEQKPPGLGRRGRRPPPPPVIDGVAGRGNYMRFTQARRDCESITRAVKANIPTGSLAEVVFCIFCLFARLCQGSGSLKSVRKRHTSA